MHNQASDQHIALSPDSGSSGQSKDSLYTSLSRGDFKETLAALKRLPEISNGHSETSSGHDVLNVGNIWDQEKLHGIADAETFSPSGISSLNQKIQEKAASNIEKTMTDKEKQQLAKDSAEYRKQTEWYDRLMLTYRGMMPPEPPKMPESVARYEAAVREETAKLTKKVASSI